VLARDLLLLGPAVLAGKLFIGERPAGHRPALAAGGRATIAGRGTAGRPLSLLRCGQWRHSGRNRPARQRGRARPAAALPRAATAGITRPTRLARRDGAGRVRSRHPGGGTLRHGPGPPRHGRRAHTLPPRHDRRRHLGRGPRALSRGRGHRTGALGTRARRTGPEAAVLVGTARETTLLAAGTRPALQGHAPGGTTAPPVAAGPAEVLRVVLARSAPPGSRPAATLGRTVPAAAGVTAAIARPVAGIARPCRGVATRIRRTSARLASRVRLPAARLSSRVRLPAARLTAGEMLPATRLATRIGRPAARPTAGMTRPATGLAAWMHRTARLGAGIVLSACGLARVARPAVGIRRTATGITARTGKPSARITHRMSGPAA
jgi:hypothetical protein